MNGTGDKATYQPLQPMDGRAARARAALWASGYLFGSLRFRNPPAFITPNAAAHGCSPSGKSLNSTTGEQGVGAAGDDESRPALATAGADATRPAARSRLSKRVHGRFRDAGTSWTPHRCWK